MSATARLPIETFRYEVLKQRAEVRHRTTNPIQAACLLQRQWREQEGKVEMDGIQTGQMLLAVRAALGRTSDDTLIAAG